MIKSRPSLFIRAPWFKTQLVVNVNQKWTCNANFDRVAINLYSGGHGCANTGLLADVIYHEWGHALHWNTAGIEDDALAEGFGDIMSTVMTHSPLQGIGFYIASCGPISDISRNRSYPRDKDLESHDEGAIISSTFWELFEILKIKW